MRLNWGEVRALTDFANAPKTEGLYIIGVYTGTEALPREIRPAEDEFLGARYPCDFEYKYIGRAFKTTIYQRIKDHYEKSSNKHIREYLRSGQGPALAYISTVFAGDNGPLIAAQYEHLFLTGISPWWNVKKSEQKSFQAAMLAMLAKNPIDFRLETFSQWYDPQNG